MDFPKNSEMRNVNNMKMLFLGWTFVGVFICIIYLWIKQMCIVSWKWREEEKMESKEKEAVRMEKWMDDFIQMKNRLEKCEEELLKATRRLEKMNSYVGGLENTMCDMVESATCEMENKIKCVSTDTHLKIQNMFAMNQTNTEQISVLGNKLVRFMDICETDYVVIGIGKRNRAIWVYKHNIITFVDLLNICWEEEGSVLIVSKLTQIKLLPFDFNSFGYNPMSGFVVDSNSTLRFHFIIDSNNNNIRNSDPSSSYYINYMNEIKKMYGFLKKHNISFIPHTSSAHLVPDE